MRLAICSILFTLSLSLYAQTSVVDSLYILEEDTAFVVIDGIDELESPAVLPTTYLEISGKVYPVLISEDDTIVLASIEHVSVTSPRTFANDEEYRRYRKYKYYAAKVYPYAAEAIKIFREMEYATKHMKKRKRKKYIKKLSEDLKVEFEDPLKGLSKTQGKILVKMIERELDTPMNTLIRNLQGRFKAFYWNQASKLYGYRLKNGYVEGENPILDAVLQDLNISYEVPEEYGKRH